MMRMWGAVCAVAGVLTAVAAEARKPIEVYGKDPEISNVRLSADGAKVAMIQVENGGNPTLLVMDLATRKAVGFDLGELKVRQIEWSSDRHMLVYASKTTRMMQFRSSLVEFCGVFSINTETRADMTQLLVKNDDLALQSSLCDVESHLWNDRGDVLMSARAIGGSSRSMESVRAKGDATGVAGEVALYRVSGENGRGERIARGIDSTRAWITSPKGYVIARVEHAQRANRYRIMIPTNKERLGDWKTAFAEETEIPTLSIYGATADESALIIGTRQQSGLFALFEMSLKDGSIGKPLFEPDGVDIDDAITDPYTGHVVGATYKYARTEQIFFQNDLQSTLIALQKALKDWQTVNLVSWDKARKKFVIFAQGNVSAGDFFLFDVTKGKLEHLASMRRAFKGPDIAPVRSYFYKARDDMPIHAFLTLPPGTPEGAEPNGLPLVVLPHGGPAQRDAVTFDYWAQALASRGYGVLQMNFRGSEGYGGPFQYAGYGEWGGKMQDDVTDGVKDLIEKGLADPARVCIVGGSYGGYAALAGAAFTPELYKCAVSVNGLSDLGRFLSWQANRYGAESSTYEFWMRSIGNPSEDGEMIKARSPAHGAGNIRADVLLIHGEDDTIVPFEQSKMMHDALKDAGKPVELVRLDGEDHWLSTAKTRTEMLKAMEGFLAKHIGG
ncbi:MAG: S9 family peptidase [Rhodospirillaceae bacterium]|nr:S9 family peptidase [Rhodospirillaceae bacterium]